MNFSTTMTSSAILEIDRNEYERWAHDHNLNINNIRLASWEDILRASVFSDAGKLHPSIGEIKHLSLSTKAPGEEFNPPFDLAAICHMPKGSLKLSGFQLKDLTKLPSVKSLVLTSLESFAGIERLPLLKSITFDNWLFRRKMELHFPENYLRLFKAASLRMVDIEGGANNNVISRNAYAALKQVNELLRARFFGRYHNDLAEITELLYDKLTEAQYAYITL